MINNMLLKRDENIVINSDMTLIQALKKMDTVKHKMLLVFQKEHFCTILTIGDLQRAIINNISLSSDVLSVIDTNTKRFCSSSDNIDYIKKTMLSMRAEFMPILDQLGNLVKIYHWEDFFKEDSFLDSRPKLALPVVIMAGGIGSRLKPLTNIIPKALVPIGENTILETILKQFELIGCSEFFLSLNYKSDMIKYYLDSLEHHYNISYLNEIHPLGTIGSLSLLRDKNFCRPIFVSNCDILIDQDFRDVYDYHIKNSNDITLITSVKSYIIPYGVIETGDNGLINSLHEKPEYTYMINTGVYIIQPELLKEIPINQFYHITDLIEKVRIAGGRIGCFPVSEYSWTDIGEWDKYLNYIKVK